MIKTGPRVSTFLAMKQLAPLWFCSSGEMASENKKTKHMVSHGDFQHLVSSGLPKGPSISKLNPL